VDSASKIKSCRLVLNRFKNEVSAPKSLLIIEKILGHFILLDEKD
jgi:hypothetical protein